MGLRISVRLVVHAAILTLACALITGCAGRAAPTPSQSTGEGAAEQSFVDLDGFKKEYLDAVSVLELPPGIVFPSDPYDGGAGSFGTGVATVQAQAYWMHAWQQEWLAQRNKDASREQRAFDVLKNEVPESAFMTKYTDQASRDLYDERIRKAELGDPSGIQQDVLVNPMALEKSGE